MKFSKYIIIAAAIALVMINFANAQSKTSVAHSYYTDCAMNVSLINQNPNPAQPDSYVDVVFQVNWLQNYVCNGSTFELVSSYPFSLDDNASTVRSLPADTYVPDYSKDWMIPYHLRVDKDALDGNTKVKVLYSPGIWGNETPSIRWFNLTVQVARTNFDAVLQDIQGSSVSIAIANSGKYTANSVVVRVPEQQDFTVTGTDGQMVGNLASGDYTVVGFTVVPKGVPSNFSRQSNFSRSNVANVSRSPASPQTLKFDIYYTDNIGERRIVNMSLPFKTTATNGTFSFSRNGSTSARTATRSSSSSSPTLLIVAVVCIIAGSAIYLFIRRRSKAKKRDSEKGEVPEWVRNVKAKEKK